MHLQVMNSQLIISMFLIVIWNTCLKFGLDFSLTPYLMPLQVKKKLMLLIVNMKIIWIVMHGDF
jgi:hypothetical protein